MTPPAADPPAFDAVPVGDDVPPAFAATLETAFGCPDFFLLGAAAHLRAEWVLAFAAEAIRRGDRLLLLAADSSTADRFAAALPVVRAVSPAEDAAAIPDAVLAKTAAAAADRIEDRRRAAVAELSRIDAARAKHAAAEGVWGRLRAAAAVPHPPHPADPARRAAVAGELDALTAELHGLAPLAAARHGGKLLTATFWKSVFAGDVTARTVKLTSRAEQLEAELRDLSECEAAAGRAADAAADFRAAAAALASIGLAPPTTPADLPAAEAVAAADRRQLDRLHSAAAEDAAYWGDAAARLSEELAAAVVVVAPRGAGADAAVRAGGFTRAVVDAADLFSADDFADFRTDAMPWCLTADPRPGPGPLAELWAAHHRPAWMRDGERLVCRLAECGEPRWREPLADRPEIELDFGTAGGKPVLAAVTFDADAAAGAKGWLAREADAVTLHVLGVAVRTEVEGRVEIRWPSAGPAGAAVEISPGVCEWVTAGLPVTAKLAFGPEWTAEAVSAWLRDHAALPRAAVLE